MPPGWSNEYELNVRVISGDGSTFIGERSVSSWVEGSEFEVSGTSYTMQPATQYKVKYLVKK